MNNGQTFRLFVVLTFIYLSYGSDMSFYMDWLYWFILSGLIFGIAFYAVKLLIDYYHGSDKRKTDRLKFSSDLDKLMQYAELVDKITERDANRKSQKSSENQRN